MLSGDLSVPLRFSRLYHTLHMQHPLTFVSLTGVVPIVVITKKKSGDFIEVEKAFKRMGAENIISIENYTKEDHIKTQGRTRDILTIIASALTDVGFRLGQARNPRRDWVQRKKFLLDYIHKADQEKKEQEWRREDQRRRAEEERRREEEEEKNKCVLC